MFWPHCNDETTLSIEIDLVLTWLSTMFRHLVDTSPRTQWPSFRRRYFQMYFHERKVLYFDKKNSQKFVPKCPIDNNLALV